MATAPKRGEVWLIQFEPAVGAEMRKIRPAVVISRDEVGRLPLRLVVPITDWKPWHAQCPWFVPLPASRASGLFKTSGADAFQTKSVFVTRFVRRLGHASRAQLDEIAAAIALCIGLP